MWERRAIRLTCLRVSVADSALGYLVKGRKSRRQQPSFSCYQKVPRNLGANECRPGRGSVSSASSAISSSVRA